MRICVSPIGRPTALLPGAVCAFAALAVGACEGSQRARDASAPPTERTGEIAIRVDVATEGPSTISVLAFRASVAGLPLSDVLGVVDPLAARAPDDRCALLDVDVAARALRAGGGVIELEEMAGIEVVAADRALRPAPRLYPDMATVVGGVVAESGPDVVGTVPDVLRIYFSDRARTSAELAVPPVPRVESVGGALAIPHARLAAGDLEVIVSGGGGSAVEIRPYGATAAVSCPVGADGRVLIPRTLIERVAAGGHRAVSFDAVRRESVTVRLPNDGQPARMSVEVRSSTLMELGP